MRWCAQAIASALALMLFATATALAQSESIAMEAVPNDASGTIYYALDLGFFQQAGLNVSLSSLNNPGSAAAAIAGGSIPIGALPISVAAIAREHGLPLTMIAPAGLYLSSSPTSAIIVLKTSTVRTASDLNGKTIATRDLSNMSYLAAKLWMDGHGGDSQSAHWVEINDPLDVAALQAGRIDAASISEPALDAALHGGEVRSIAPVFDAIGSRFLIGAYYTSEAYATAHPDVVRKFADVIAAASVWANKNRPASATILAKYAQTPVLPGSTRVTFADRLSAADVQPVLDVLLKFGLLKKPVRAKDLFSTVVPSH